MVTDAALAIAVPLIAEFEGFRSEPYLDSGGVPTIGYGFTVTETGQHVTMQTPPITQEAAYARLQSMVGRVLAKVRGMVYVPISDHAASALTSFAFNAGTNALRTSSLLEALNKGNTQEAARSFASWCYAGGHYNEGLVNRRKREAEVFLTPDDPTGNHQNPAIPAGSSVRTAPEEITPTPTFPPDLRSQEIAPPEDEADVLNAAELQTINPTPEQAT